MDARGKHKDRNNKESMLSASTRLLVAIAGAVSLNRKCCLETLVPTALRRGIMPEEIAEVVHTVTGVRENSNAFILDSMTKLLGH